MCLHWYRLLDGDLALSSTNKIVPNAVSERGRCVYRHLAISRVRQRRNSVQEMRLNLESEPNLIPKFASLKDEVIKYLATHFG